MVQFYIILFIVILLPRLLFVFVFPETGGDYEIYSTVAKNILKGCGVSLSDPLKETCLPHFGGNHGPGYPFFISIIWYIFGENNYLIRLFQAIIYSFCCLYLLLSIDKLLKDRKSVTIIGFLLSFSPLLIAWPRFLQTETLSIAFSLFLLAEIILSLIYKKLRIFPIAFALILATWIRLDNIFMCIPIIFLSFYLHDFKNAVIRGSYIAIILFSTWGMWTLRNISVGLPKLIPTEMVMPNGGRPPTGYLKWTKTWLTHEYERAGALWGINRNNYNNISIPTAAFKDPQEEIIIYNLLKELKVYDKKDFPKHIDDQFNKIAIHKIKENPLDFWIVNPAIRAMRIWTNPFSSFGWPNQMTDQGISNRDRLAGAKGDKSILIEKAIEYPFNALSKGINAIYRIIVMMLFIYCLILLFKEKKFTSVYPLGIVTLLYILSRTIFFSFGSNFETRYMVTTIPFIETFISLTLINFYKKNRS